MFAPVLLLAVLASPSSSPTPIFAHADPRQPWTVATPNGAVFGRQNGVFEVWMWPNKILSNFRISAELADYNVPIDVNALAATIEVTGAETTITYAHAAFTVKQRVSSSAAVPGIEFEVQSTRKLTLRFSFTPEMLPAWPAAQFGRPDAEWKDGAYILHTASPSLTGYVGMTGSEPGILPPYQERPQIYPLQFIVRYDPKTAKSNTFPLLLTQGFAGSSFQRPDPAELTYVESPNKQLDEAAKWANVAVTQMQVNHNGETGLVAGYYESAASARPGYAWFFGRDTLWTTYAINSFGDFALTKGALEFLIRRQREDGKIMHEYSQTADQVDWKSTPYFYAAADSVPLFIMAVWDYVRASGDVAFLQQNWGAVQKAWRFERSHDSDHDGIYENTEGTGWVESWPPGMPHQEIYLAALDEQASDAMSRLAAVINDRETADEARDSAAKIAAAVRREYLPAGSNFYAFSRNADGTLDTTETIYPSVAWWQNTWSLPGADAMVAAWASREISTDWGTRDVSEQTPFYDPISYHQGSVWPLFTGWVSMAEYRAGHAAAAYEHLLENARLTWFQDLGSATELLSGQFYEPLGRSSSHQMWSSAMITIPLLRGLFGIEADGLHHRLLLQPHLPASWDHATVHHVAVGNAYVELSYRRVRGKVEISADTDQPATLCLDTSRQETNCTAQPARHFSVAVAVPPIEIESQDSEPHEGDETHGMKILGEQDSAHTAEFTLSGPGGSTHAIFVRSNVAGTLETRTVQFPAGSGYQQAAVKASW